MLIEFFKDVLLRIEVTGYKVSVAVILKYRFNLAANIHTFTAAGMKFTALGRICGRRNIALQNDTLDFCIRVGNRHRREQRFGVRMHRICKQILFASELNHIAEIHNADLVGYMLYNR